MKFAAIWGVNIAPDVGRTTSQPGVVLWQHAKWITYRRIQGGPWRLRLASGMVL